MNSVISSSMRLLSVAVGCLLLTLLMGTPIQAQVETGRILGMVKDQSGAVIPGAKVTLTNEETNLTLTMTTGPTGYYMFPGIRIGNYKIEVEAKGFSKYVHAGVTLHVQEDAVVDATLVPGVLTQTIQVTAAAPVLQTQNASLGRTVESQVINDLPLNGRNWTTLAQLGAGVSQWQAGGVEFTANGHPGEQNYYMLNGANNNADIWGPYDYVALPPPDAIAEFKVQTSNYSVEIGHSAGGIVNAQTKSGTNQLHGDAWEYVRNDKFDAANFFENTSGISKGAFRQNQFGATFGGPVYIPHLYNGKNKSFFFVDYQGLRVRQASATVDTVPTSSMVNSGFTNLQDLITYSSGTRTDNLGRTFPLGTMFDPATTRNVTAGQTDPVTDIVAPQSGFVRDPFYQGSLVGITNFVSPAIESNLNLLPAGRLDPNAIKLLNLYPAPNQAGFYNDYTYGGPLSEGNNQVDFRVDHNFSARDQIFLFGDLHKDVLVTPQAFPGLGGEGQLYTAGPEANHTTAFGLSETHFFSPTMINEARLAYNRGQQTILGNYANTMGIPEQFGIQGIPQVADNGGLPAFNIAGLTSMGTAGWVPTTLEGHTWDLTENITKVYGAHTFKGGFQGDYMYGPIWQPSWSHGGFDFGGLYTEVPNTGGGAGGMAQLLLTPTASSVPDGFANVGGEDAVYASNLGPTTYERYYFGIYFQDDWKVTPRLTVNLGLRWDHLRPYTERWGAQANFVPGPPFNGAAFLIPTRRCNDPNDPLSPSFEALTKLDGIAVTCSSNLSLGKAQNTNFAPRVGIAYRVTPKVVLRAGYGMFYGALGSTGYGAGLGNNYPFQYSFNYFAPDAADPITYPNGSLATLETGFSGINLSPAAVNAEGLDLIGRQYNYQTAYFEDYNFAVQYQVTPNQAFTLAYVGNEGHHEGAIPGLNEATEILPPGLNPQLYVPYPDFTRDSPYEETAGNTYYNSLQTTFERRFSRGFTFNANYTWSHCRSDWRAPSSSTIGGYRAATLPGFGLRGDYSYCDADEPNIFHFSGLYSLPLGKGRYFLGNSKGVVNQLIGGWRINWIMTMQDGQPFNIGCPISTTADFGCYALLVPGQNIYAGPHNVNQWINPAAFANPPVATTIGQSDYAPLGGSPTQAHGPGEHRLDFSIFKEFPVSESKRFEFRAEFFNLTNTPWFASPSYTDFTNPATFGQIISLQDGASDPRQIQLALKFYF
jgi:hypothetical protein